MVNHQSKVNSKSDKRIKWNWIGHTLRKETGAKEKTALNWNPLGYRRRGRPNRTWQRTIKDEIRITRRSWNEVKGIAGGRNAWKLLLMPYAPQRVKGFDDIFEIVRTALHISYQF